MKLKNIILADDHTFIRLGLVQILKDEFPDVTIAEVADGESLVKEVFRGNFDLVITDLDMHGRSGLDALEQIKTVKPELPVLVLSIYPEDLYAIRALKTGASGYLNKNSAPEELVAAIHRVMDGKRYITPEIAEKLVDFNGGKQPHELLSNRELEVFKMIASGQTLSEISEALSLAPSTVSTHRSRIMEKLQLHSNADLTRYAITHQIITDLGSH